jgi:putative flippase GtrA
MEKISVKKLEIADTLKDGVAIGMKNIGPILVNILLYVLTVWIPYINIGTTIGLAVGIISKASRDETISFTEIFDPKYRKYMGEFFLTTGLVSIGVSIGCLLFIIPGIVISIAWTFAPLLAIDKGKNPMEAIILSNNITYGNKARMFAIIFIAGLAFSVVCAILLGIGGATGSSGVMGFMGFLVTVLTFVFTFALIGIQASMYKQLAGNV